MVWLKAAFLLLAAAGDPAPASGADAMVGFYGATLEISNLEGWRAKRLINPGGVFTQTGSDGPAEGVWTIQDGKLCVTQTKPEPLPDRARTYCNAGPGQQAGRTWIDQDPVTGNAIIFSLVPGRP